MVELFAEIAQRHASSVGGGVGVSDVPEPAPRQTQELTISQRDETRWEIWLRSSPFAGVELVEGGTAVGDVVAELLPRHSVREVVQPAAGVRLGLGLHHRASRDDVALALPRAACLRARPGPAPSAADRNMKGKHESETLVLVAELAWAILARSQAGANAEIENITGSDGRGSRRARSLTRR